MKNPIAKKSIVSWIIYDTGNTVFFTGAIGLVFPLWITRVMGGDDALVGFTLAAAMAAVFFLSPVLGAASDHTGKKMPFLIFFTLLSVVATALIGTLGLMGSLILFAVGTTAIHTADVFYNALLVDISSRSNMGVIAGVGIGLGYFGAIIAVVLAILFVGPLGHVFVFRAFAVVMFVLMLPLLIIGKDKSSLGPKPRVEFSKLIRYSVSKLTVGVRDAYADRVWARFLVARFWYMWAVNGASAFGVLYGTKTVGLSEFQVQIIILVGIITGIPSGALWGKLVDKHGASRILKSAVCGWLVLLIISAMIPILGLPAYVWGVVAVLCGACMAGLYVAERPLIINIAPPQRTAEYFGFNSMSGRLAAVAAPFSWGFIVVTLGMGQLAAVIWLAVCVTLSISLLLGLHVREPGETRVDSD